MYGSKLYISRSALSHNIDYYRNLIGNSTKLLVNLKGNAYGHGAILIGKYLDEDPRVDYFGVAFGVEGVELREHGIKKPVLVYQPPLEWNEFPFDLHLEPVLASVDSIKSIISYLKDKKINQYPVHIKIDTGMHRSGIMPEEVHSALALLSSTPVLKPLSVFSHLAAAEDPDEDDFTRHQARVFERYSRNFKEKFPGIILHIGKSASLARMPELNMGMVRPGFGIWGYSDDPEERKKLRPIGEWKSHITQIRKIKAGETVGYNRLYKAKKDTQIALISAGYADGYLRSLGNKSYVNIKGENYPVVGKVSMDMLTVDIGDAPLKIGDEVVLMGKNPDIYKLAEWAGTSPYVVSTRITRRVQRVMID